MAPFAQGCLGNLIMPLYLQSRNWQLGDKEVSHENWRGWRDLRSITLLWSGSQKKDHRGAARNTHWRSQTLHSPPTSNQRPGKVYKDQFWSVFEWLFGSWTPSATYDFWHSTTKSSEVFLLLGASKRLFFKLKWTQRIEIPFVSYGTKTLTQGQLRSIDTPEWFSGQDLVLTFSGWHYVSHYTEKFPDTTDELLNNTYVDDVQLGGNDSNQSIKLKKRPQRLRRKEVFISTNGRVTYQSWKNVRKLTSQASRTYAKLEVGTNPKETKILGVLWNKAEDKLSVRFMKPLQAVAERPLKKRKMLSAVNGVHDLLRVAAPVVSQERSCTVKLA